MVDVFLGRVVLSISINGEPYTVPTLWLLLLPLGIHFLQVPAGGVQVEHQRRTGRGSVQAPVVATWRPQPRPAFGCHKTKKKHMQFKLVTSEQF